MVATGRLLVISGPSGVGKTSLLKNLLQRAEREQPGVLELSISHTTRSPRAGEEHGSNYYFVTRAEFEECIKAGDFLEYAEIYGNLYGTSRTEVQKRMKAGKRVILEIDWQGAAQIRNSDIPHHSVFILPPDLESLRQRLQARALDCPATIRERLSRAESEMEHADKAARTLCNRDFSQTLEKLYQWCFED